MAKIKITETQLIKIQEDNLIDKGINIDGFIDKGDITALAHHYAKCDDEGKKGILDKAQASKGDVFANKIKVRASNILESESNFIQKDLGPESHHEAMAILANPNLKQHFYTHFKRDQHIILLQSGQTGEYFLHDPLTNVTYNKNLNKIDMRGTDPNSTDITKGIAEETPQHPVIQQGTSLAIEGIGDMPYSTDTFDTGERHNDGDEAVKQLFASGNVNPAEVSIQHLNGGGRVLTYNGQTYNISGELYHEIEPMLTKNHLEETTTTGSVGGQYSSKYFLDPSHAKNPPLTFKGGAVVKVNDKTHTSGVNSFTVVKGKLYEDIHSEVQEMISSTISKALDGKSSDKEFIDDVDKGLGFGHDVVDTIDSYKDKTSPENMEMALNSISNNMDSVVDEDLEQSLQNPANFQKVPKQIVRIVNQLNDLISQCVDEDGDPVGVYDNSSTWQQEFVYDVDIVKNKVIINSQDRFGKAETPEIYPMGNNRAWNEWAVYDCVGRIKHLMKNYKRTIKGLPKRQSAIDAEMQDNDKEITQETIQNMDNNYRSMEEVPELQETIGDELGGTVDAAPVPAPEGQEGEHFTTGDLYDVFEKVTNEYGKESELSQTLKSILIEYGDFENPDAPVDPKALEAFKAAIPSEEPQPAMQETTGSASSGQFSAPLGHEPEHIVDEENASYTDLDSSVSIETDYPMLVQAFGKENVKMHQAPNWAYHAYVKINNSNYIIGAMQKGDQKLYAVKHKGYKEFETFPTLEPLIDTIKGYESSVEHDTHSPEVASRIGSLQEEENMENKINEEALTISPAMANLKRIHGETAKITKAEMVKTKNETIKATKADGSQFVGKSENEVKGVDSENAIPIDHSVQTAEVDMIKKGMEDLEYDIEPGKTFEDRFKNNINPDLSTDAVTDQFGHKTPAGEMANVLPSEVGGNILKNAEKKKKEEEPPMYAKDPQPIIKEGVYKETEDLLITEEEKQRIDEDAERMKKLIGYKPSVAVSTKGNKVDNSLFKKKI